MNEEVEGRFRLVYQGRFGLQAELAGTIQNGETVS